MFPKLTTTFVDREIQALEESGAEVRVVSLYRPKGPLSAYQQELLRKTTYLFPASPLRVLFAHLHFLVTQPRRYLSTLLHIQTRPHPTLLSHRRTLMHFWQGIYATYCLRKQPGDHFHAHFLNQSATTALILRRMLNIPYSVTVHASGEFFATPMMLQTKLEEAKFIATCTRYNRDHLAELGRGLFDRRVVVNYHGLDSDKFHRNAPRPVDPPVILSVGQLRERKGLLYLVQACGLLKEQGIDFRCRIVGEGPDRALLEREIRACGLVDYVRLDGVVAQEALVGLYEQASLFTLPAVQAESGDRDGIPNVILEAMAMELPVVSTWNSAIPEVIRDGKNGLLVPPRDARVLADALHHLITNPSAAARMAQDGQRTVREMFDPQRNIQVLINAFQA